jgi:hypothetical protein
MHQLNRGFVVGFSLLAGCGAVQLNESQRRGTIYALHAAELEGASQHPWTARLLARARVETMAADKSADNGDESNSILLLERAKADADLARQLTRTWDEQQRARVAWSKLGSDDPFGPERDIDREHEDTGGAL